MRAPSVVVLSLRPDISVLPPMARLSQLLLPTERQAPADAEALSHKLMVRAGLVRQVGAGLWSWLPAGWRGHPRAGEIVRGGIDAIGRPGRAVPGVKPAQRLPRPRGYHSNHDEQFP